MFSDSFKKSLLMFAPQKQMKNPVMFVTYLGAIFTSLLLLKSPTWFNFQIALWLLFTVFFANFAEAFAESRAKAQALSLKKMQTDVNAKKIINGIEAFVPAMSLKKGDVILCACGEIIPVDGEVVEGIATVDESAITGESAPVIRESGGDRSAVTAGTKVVSDKLIIKVTSEPGHSFLDRIIHLIEGAKRKKTPNEIALNIVLSTMTILFLLVVSSLELYADYSSKMSYQNVGVITTLPILISLLVCLIPTTISALLNAIGISGMDRLVSRNVIAKSGRSVEAAGDVDLLIIDKTGTITLGNRRAVNFITTNPLDEKELAKISQMASLSDETPEGRSIVVLAKKKFEITPENLNTSSLKFTPFSAQTRMSGVDFLNEKGEVTRSIRKGAVEAIVKYVEKLGGIYPLSLSSAVEKVAKSGGTPLLVSDDKRIVGIIHLKDVIKGGIKSKFKELRKMGIKTVMVTGDNPVTAAAIAAEAGVDDFIAEATPELKLQKIQEEQAKGHMVAMAGDGTNDAPALAQADVGVAMNTGTQASREAGNMVDLDSNPTKLIEIIKIGKQLLITRGALTTFSIANDVGKYFAILPAIFGALYMPPNGFDGSHGPLSILNVMTLHSPQSAILSAVIFNAVIIILLIPLSLRGVRYRADSATKLLGKNITIYGIGGIIAPFIGIKIIDMFITNMGLVL